MSRLRILLLISILTRASVCLILERARSIADVLATAATTTTIHIPPTRVPHTPRCRTPFSDTRSQCCPCGWVVAVAGYGVRDSAYPFVGCALVVLAGPAFERIASCRYTPATCQLASRARISAIKRPSIWGTWPWSWLLFFLQLW